MSRFSCVIQEGSQAAASTEVLERRLRAHHAAHFDGEASTVAFVAVPTGYMFTEGRQSTSSVIACAIAHTTTLPRREAYMRGICDLWSEVTGCTDHEIVVSVSETV
ncbi:MAG: hypothetical protein AAF081_10315 [Actinomycetota bacterium]